jgi:hypothetical protein
MFGIHFSNEERRTKMKKVVVVALLLGIVCGAAFAGNTINISTLGGMPDGWAPGVGNDIDMTTATTYNLPLSGAAYRVHVGLPYGMSSLRIDIPITLVQDLVPLGGQSLGSTVVTATLTGQVNYCTYFTVESNLEMNLTPTATVPEPGGLLVLCSGLVSLVGFTIRKRR